MSKYADFVRQLAEHRCQSQGRHCTKCWPCKARQLLKELEEAKLIHMSSEPPRSYRSDFKCPYGKCDAHGFYGPGCSVPGERVGNTD